MAVVKGCDMDTFSTAQVARRFGVADQTVKNWAAEFAQYLSPTATPEPGKRRAFTVEDVAILAVVHEMVGRGRDTDAAHTALRAGQRGAGAIVAAQNGDTLITVQRDRDMLQGAVLELRSLLEAERASKQSEVDRRDQRIIELERQLARTELLLELSRGAEAKPKGE
jgi:DNA-binding transcriptional MerR regulator